ncbi:hypothetical protein M408DRAFT_152972 [Serendipita vermifera MAFF 305830]|uniref:Uncharacterized protein n=1 Tax=Serendipita vermifera MAFF 305830 TaxID=933852 RepID=A0A0C3B933_SERVB|nr:hypothetical protein M408DRAFT_152972 [Serendipita vermifera MAFF 305830]
MNSMSLISCVVKGGSARANKSSLPSSGPDAAASELGPREERRPILDALEPSLAPILVNDRFVRSVPELLPRVTDLSESARGGVLGNTSDLRGYPLDLVEFGLLLTAFDGGLLGALGDPIGLGIRRVSPPLEFKVALSFDGETACRKI